MSGRVNASNTRSRFALMTRTISNRTPSRFSLFCISTTFVAIVLSFVLCFQVTLEGIQLPVPELFVEGQPLFRWPQALCIQPHNLETPAPLPCYQLRRFQHLQML